MEWAVGCRWDECGGWMMRERQWILHTREMTQTSVCVGGGGDSTLKGVGILHILKNN